MTGGTLSMGNLFGSLGFHNTIAGGSTPAAPVAPPLPAQLATPATPQPPAPLPDPLSLTNMQAGRRAMAAASNGGITSTILSQFGASRSGGRSPSAGAGGGTSDYSKSTLSAG